MELRIKRRISYGFSRKYCVVVCLCDAFETTPTNGYDPLDDVAESPEGVWAWATDKPGLRQSIKVRVTLGLLRSSKNQAHLVPFPVFHRILCHLRSVWEK